MSRVKRLAKSYGNFIAVPWREDAAAAQRVVFCVYHEEDELGLRAKVDEFELATRDAGHGWCLCDLTDMFPEWLSSQRYAPRYFEKPQLLSTLLPKFQKYIAQEFETKYAEAAADPNCVVSLLGVGSLFGLLKVKGLVDELAPLVQGRLLVFFPGSFEDNNYRLLDGYDGWNYLAVPITADNNP